MNTVFLASRKGFSILVALGVTGFLLVLVLWLVTLFLREMQITRAVYDGVVTYAWAEGAFEYAMLKVKNHREWFSDAVTKDDPEYRMLSWANLRTQKLTTRYTIHAQAKTYSGVIPATSHLVIPLFVGTGVFIGPSSIDPRADMRIVPAPIEHLSLAWLGLGWNIVANDRITGESVGIAGKGDITPDTLGNLRTYHVDCYDRSGQLVDCKNTGDGGDAVEYMVEKTIPVNDFIGSGNLTNFYLIVFNHYTNEVYVELSARSPFALPLATVTSSAELSGRAAQTIELSEDKTRLLESLKYGIFSGE